MTLINDIFEVLYKTDIAETEDKARRILRIIEEYHVSKEDIEKITNQCQTLKEYLHNLQMKVNDVQEQLNLVGTSVNDINFKISCMHRKNVEKEKDKK